MKITFSEWNNSYDKNLFECLVDVMSGNELIEVLGEPFLNMYYELNYGDRLVPTKISLQDTQDVAEILKMVYNSKWNSLSVTALDISSYDGFDTETIIEEKNNDKNFKELTGIVRNDVAGYESSDLEVDTETSDSLNELGGVDKEKKYIKRERDIRNLDIRQQMIDNTNIVKIICDDIADVISLKIF